jgi:hypothetical protein
LPSDVINAPETDSVGPKGPAVGSDNTSAAKEWLLAKTNALAAQILESLFIEFLALN